MLGTATENYKTITAIFINDKGIGCMPAAGAEKIGILRW